VLQRELGDVETGHPVEHASTPNAEFGIRAEVFGHPRVMVSARQIADLEWRSERSKELFFYLLHARRPLRKEQIASDLWPELTPDRVNSMFHSTLYRLRRAIDPQIAVQTDGGYQISRTFTISYDAREFDDLVGEAEAARPGSEDAVSRRREAVDLYRGPFADGFVSEWAESSRRYFEQRYFSSLLALADHALRAGDLVEAARLSEIALSTDALSEEAARLLMVAHSRAGRLDLAARAYRHVHEAMERELGEEPSAATQETYRQVLTGAALGSNGD
jgi:two-component SAPR family response regulator